MPHPSMLAAAPQALSAEDLFARVEALVPRLAVFDCDGTLWSGDAGSSFMWWTMSTGLLAKEKVTWLQSRYDGYRNGEVSELAICGEMVQVYAGLEEDTLRQAAATFFREQIEPQIFPELRALVADLQQRGTEIWAVSSTNNWVIEEGVRQFGIDPQRVLAARVAVKAGRITDRLLDVPTDEGKVTALNNAGVTDPDAVFGNSVHDAAMLAIARQAFPINPTPALVERAAQERWPIFQPAAPARPHLEDHP